LLSLLTFFFRLALADAPGSPEPLAAPATANGSTTRPKTVAAETITRTRLTLTSS
jgi:hypothetical protein